MKEFSKQHYGHLEIKYSNNIYQDLHFDRCVFAGPSFGHQYEFQKWSRVKNVTLTNCTFRQGSYLTQAALEDCVVENLKTLYYCTVDACVYKHVVFKGSLGYLKLNSPEVLFNIGEATMYEPCIAATKKYYQKVDWALDISALETRGLEIYGVPTHLIRRNPDLHAVVRKENVPRDFQERLKDKVSVIVTAQLDKLLTPRYDQNSLLLIVPTLATYYKEYLAGVKYLRKVGIADAD